MHNPSILITSGNVAQTGTNRNSYYCRALRGVGGEREQYRQLIGSTCTDRGENRQPSWSVRVA